MRLLLTLLLLNMPFTAHADSITAKAFNNAMRDGFACINASTVMKITDPDHILGWDLVLGKHMQRMNKVIDQFADDPKKRQNMKNNVQYMAITAQQDIAENKLPRLIGNQQIPFDRFINDMKKHAQTCAKITQSNR